MMTNLQADEPDGHELFVVTPAAADTMSARQGSKFLALETSAADLAALARALSHAGPEAETDSEDDGRYFDSSSLADAKSAPMARLEASTSADTPILVSISDRFLANSVAHTSPAEATAPVTP